MTASRYVIEGGKEKVFEEIGAPDGTTVIVRDLFYNTPARAKFLRSETAEGSAITAFVEQLMLSNPDVSVQYIINGKVRYMTSGNGSVKDLLFHIYGKETSQNLIPVDVSEGAFALKGFIGKPAISRGSRDLENCFINDRFVRSKTVMKAVEKGFGTMLMQHQFPFCCLFLSMSPGEVDVNVHPAKMEVRFIHEKELSSFIEGAVRDALSGRNMMIDIDRPETEKKVIERSPEVFEKKALTEKEEVVSSGDRAGNDTSSSPNVKKVIYVADEVKDDTKPFALFDELPVFGSTGARPSANDLMEPTNDDNSKAQAVSEDDIKAGDTVGSKDKDVTDNGFIKGEQLSFFDGSTAPEVRPEIRFVGQIFSTYWIIERDKIVYVIDQHAAHERVMYERFMEQYKNGKITSQNLMPPRVITLSPEEQRAAGEYGEALKELGFEIEGFGGNEFALRTIPYTVGNVDPVVLLRAMLPELETGHGKETLPLYVKKVATEACKAAVKGGDRISDKEAEELIKQLFECEDPYHCPHGRPTVLTVTESYIEKKFKRIV